MAHSWSIVRRGIWKIWILILVWIYRVGFVFQRHLWCKRSSAVSTFQWETDGNIMIIFSFIGFNAPSLKPFFMFVQMCMSMVYIWDTNIALSSAKVAIIVGFLSGIMTFLKKNYGRKCIFFLLPIYNIVLILSYLNSWNVCSFQYLTNDTDTEYVILIY